jgi:hypothetical protein
MTHHFLPWHPQMTSAVHVCHDPPSTQPCGHDGLPSPSGLFESVDTKFEISRDPLLDPSLEDMLVLSRNPSGFYLFVEGKWLFQTEQNGDRSRSG